MNEVYTYVYHIWNEWARGFNPEAVTPWFVREDWLKNDQEIYNEFIVRVGCIHCEFFIEEYCSVTNKAVFTKAQPPCVSPNI
ncbi:MAG: hypothetical protein SCK28_05930 [Bacillota bacterium]|nr:hypothetical protein [Bacillota bacterium]